MLGGYVPFLFLYVIPRSLELFSLLATHAATALYCTRLHARLRNSPTGIV